METILDTDAAPANPAVPLGCFDEAGKELQAQPRDPLRPGQPAREDPEDARHGSATLCLSDAPHRGWRQVMVTTQRTAGDWALAMRELVDGPFPEAERLIVVLDHRNTHRLRSLDTTFPAPAADRIARTREVRFTPKHGSWVNIAELDLAVLSQQGLARRIPDRVVLEQDVAAWVAARNAVAAPAHWTFTTEDARPRLTHLYPLPLCDA